MPSRLARRLATTCLAIADDLGNGLHDGSADAAHHGSRRTPVHEPFDALGNYAQLPLPETDAPGTAAQWNTAPLTSNLDVVGSPKLTLKVSAPAAQLTQLAGPAGQLVVFVRVQDVAPDGTASDIRALTAPVRVPNVAQPFTVTLPGFVHRFAPGHQIRLVVSGSSLNYRAGLVANPVTITTGSPAQLLTLPVVG